MNHEFEIRPERSPDINAISQVTEAAFKGHPYSQNTEQFIIDQLRRSGALSLSLVAVIHDQVVGHVAFSRVAISDGSSDWYGLGPLAVAPEFQRRGIGQALVSAGLERLREMGARGCVLVGEPGFYGRFGFRSDPCCTFEGVPQEFVLSLPFEGHAQACGAITHHEAFKACGPQS